MKKIPITRPTLEPHDAYAGLFRKTLKSGMLTMNDHGRALEEKAANYLGVKHCVTVSSCTAGLMLSFKGLNLEGEVIMPSFTFSASGLPVIWNNLKPVFADIEPRSYTLDPKSVEALITPKTSAIFATHVFGVVCDTKKLEALAKKHSLKLIFDAAHAFGSSRNGKRAGTFGDVEVFSCSPTKVLTTGEGGIVATNNDALADFVRKGRNYGDDGTNDILFSGLSARMSELNAAVGLRSLAKISKNLSQRRGAARTMVRDILKVEPRFAFQHIPDTAQTTYKDLSLYVDEQRLGFTRDQLHDYLKERGVMTRKYFYPPLHLQRAYVDYRKDTVPLPVTDKVASRVLSLPMYAHLSREEVRYVVAMIKEFIHDTKKR